MGATGSTDENSRVDIDIPDPVFFDHPGTVDRRKHPNGGWGPGKGSPPVMIAGGKPCTGAN